VTRPRSAATDAAGLARDAEDWRKRIARRARRANLELSAEQTAAHAEFLTLLSAWNARMNLTALDDRDDAVDRLILEPVAAARVLQGASAVLDVGSGIGLPTMFVLPNGKILLQSGAFAVRFTADGVLDTSFGGGDGIATVHGESGAAVASDGLILGFCDIDGAARIRRYHADGSPDASFGVAGVVTLPNVPAL